MLRHLHIRNFAIVTDLELDLDSGMTVLTGETGAGKSILLGALGLTLGDRADSGVVRPNCERAEISAGFSIAHLPGVNAWLTANELDSDSECLIRRTVSADGRSRGYINGQAVAISQLKELGEQLVDIHGQHAHQSLLKRHVQRQLLDAYAGHSELVASVESGYHQWRHLSHELEQLRTTAQEREARLDLLRYQVRELEALQITPNELDDLHEEHGRLANTNRLREGVEQAIDILYESGQFPVADLLERQLSSLQALAELDPRITSARELLEGATIQIRELATELRHYLDSLDINPARLIEVEQRLDELHTISRKHRVAAEYLPELLKTLTAELEQLETAETRIDNTQTEIAQARAHYQERATELSARRKATARSLSDMISANIRTLGMGDGRFEIALSPTGEEPSPQGLEQIEFLVSANPDQPLRPLTKVASGGELARISLAIQVITANKEGLPTLIFDEVDVGIGGGIAERVGHQLLTLGGERQVLCVTHQPQVAALAHHHLCIRKHSENDVTRTVVHQLESDERIAEVARMLGGVRITNQTLSHAAEMIGLANRNQAL